MPEYSMSWPVEKEPVYFKDGVPMRPSDVIHDLVDLQRRAQKYEKMKDHMEKIKTHANRSLA